MTLRDDVVRLLRESPGGLTDAELAARLGKLHQQVNQRCRHLADEGLLVRDRTTGTIVNRLPADAAGNLGSTSAQPKRSSATLHETRGASARDEWSWEGNVQAAVVAHPAREGWRITRVADTGTQERGVDVMAERGGRNCLVEVKGWPSRVYVRGDKAGQAKPTAPTLQARHWFAEALLAALRLRDQNPEARVVMAFPDMPRYRSLGASIHDSLGRCDVQIWLVAESGDVAQLITE